MTGQILIKVKGEPQPRGSKSAWGRVIPGQFDKKGNPRVVINVSDTNKKSKPWMDRIRVAARQQMWDEKPFDGDIVLHVLFIKERPKSHYRSGKFSHLLKPDSPNVFHSVKPDRGKLLRAVEDALTGIVYTDDARVVGGSVWKIWGDEPGVIMIVRHPTQEEIAFYGSCKISGSTFGAFPTNCGSGQTVAHAEAFHTGGAR